MSLDLPPLLGSTRLYASGLGIVLYSQDVRQTLLATESPERSALYDSALLDGRAARIATGSPQLYYECLFSSHSLPSSSSIVGQTTFGLRINGERLGICDGYAELDWTDDDYQHESVSIASGLFRVDAHYLSASRHAEDDMLIFFRVTSVPSLTNLTLGNAELFFQV